ncbi:hypothetical protein H7I53_13640 [Mycolicibacterium pulveris]|uniref:Uncharacterized protein n=1 Tax=Mycolicibacterium pulveris TaxID=36813 RepID=A0A7I7ULK1_MYCPV|nr:hypothetical protein [Mycolicibacterium pulveris]MCV6981265.1 hypothetical protein [Mycolicibacterium pulveris]BBY82292.1 hypothetical protein MPUL_34500 [Mycolicibacterium pulveris]
MGRADPAGIHFFEFWFERAQDKSLPHWLRVVGLAYSGHTKNGHAKFCLNGESTLPETLGISKRHAQNEVRKAVKNGFLDEGSNIMCLVLPSGICGGAEGNVHAKCQLHPVTESVTAK